MTRRPEMLAAAASLSTRRMLRNFKRAAPKGPGAQIKPRRIDRDWLEVGSHGAVYFYHRRRGFLAWQRFGFGGPRRASPGARLYRKAAQARSLFERRPRHDEPDAAWRGLRHRRRGRDGPRSWPL